jgi:ParB family chromosome partitioning protein
MIKKGLGRGLESLFAMYDEEIGNENITNKNQAKEVEKRGVAEIDINKIYPNPNQPRKNFDTEALNDLAKSIKVHGVIQPIVLNEQSDGTYMIIAGERRYRASKLAGLKSLPAIVKNYTDRQIKEISIIENLQREDLNPIESARAIKQLMEEYKLTQEDVSERIGKSRSNIANTLRLLALYPDVINMVENGTLSAGHARCLVVVENSTEQIRLANQAIKDKWNVRDLEKAVKKAQNPSTNVQKPIVQSLELKELIEKMQKTLATKVSAIGNDNKGRIYIDYYTRDDLDRISDMISILNDNK